jgi:hypothetical protein
MRLVGLIRIGFGYTYMETIVRSYKILYERILTRLNLAILQKMVGSVV